MGFGISGCEKSLDSGVKIGDSVGQRINEQMMVEPAKVVKSSIKSSTYTTGGGIAQPVTGSVNLPLINGRVCGRIFRHVYFFN